MASIPPSRPGGPKTEALAKAQYTREVWAELQRQVTDDEIDLAAVFEWADSDETVANLKVLKVLEALPDIGKIRSRRLLAELEISETRCLRGVGPRQRVRLLERLS